MNNKPLYLEIADHLSEKVIRKEISEKQVIANPKLWAEHSGLNPAAVENAYEILIKNQIFNKEQESYFTTEHAFENAVLYRKHIFLNDDLRETYAMFNLLNISMQDIENSYQNYLL